MGVFNKKPTKEEAIANFWKKVKIGAPDACWEWTGARHRCGYGVLQFHGKQYPAHRFALFAVNGVHPPRNLYACHRCDNRPCCNPSHLFMGTAGDNLHDAIEKGRFRGGQSTGRHKLTWPKVDHIRASNKGTVELANENGVSRSTIRSIIRRDTWKDKYRLPI